MEKLRKTEQQWRAGLTPEQYAVTRRKATERPGTGEYLHHHAAGIYRCVCCGNPVFASDTKFESHCGWPSFTAPAGGASLQEHADDSFGMQRIEVVCAKCDAHLGHVFNDGPPPAGLRYCINSLALKFEPAEESKDK